MTVPGLSSASGVSMDRAREVRAAGGFRLVRAEAFTETWAKVFGYKPDYQFPKPDAGPATPRTRPDAAASGLNVAWARRTEPGC
jgi:hypothetical protein